MRGHKADKTGEEWMAKGLFDLSGKVALITGGNGGIGLGFARGIAKQGGDVAIWARSAEKNAAAKAEIESFGVRCQTYQVDVTSESAVTEGFAATLADFGRVDSVFANSGASATTRSLLDLTSEEYHGLMNLNLHGSYYVLREGARHMVERAQAGDRGGSLVACGSLSMFMGLPGKQHYAGAKAALGAQIRAFAVEFAPYGIRANAVAPGYVTTPMTGDGNKQIDDFMASKTPMQRPGLPEDFEAIAAYLASDSSSFHSGDTIVIDGAYLIRPF
jgi:NAD(P)-dependent dehydrogenase (short-subunit alcohol dehydrogenase family)